MPELKDVKWSSYGSLENHRGHLGEWEGYQCRIVPRKDRSALYDISIVSVRNSWTEPMLAAGLTGLEAIEWCLENLEMLGGDEEERRRAHLFEQAEEARKVRDGFVVMNRLLGVEQERTFETIMGKVMAGLGLDTCAGCSREIGEEERRHVRVGRTAWTNPANGKSLGHGHIREARCTGCGPGDEFDNEPLRADEINLEEVGE